jgi:hypothetical protein
MKWNHTFPWGQVHCILYKQPLTEQYVQYCLRPILTLDKMTLQNITVLCPFLSTVFFLGIFVTLSLTCELFQLTISGMFCVSFCFSWCYIFFESSSLFSTINRVQKQQQHQQQRQQPSTNNQTTTAATTVGTIDEFRHLYRLVDCFSNGSSTSCRFPCLLPVSRRLTLRAATRDVDE